MPRLALALLFILLAVPSAARAGTYDVYACRLPDHSAAPARGWERVATGAAAGAAPSSYVVDDCLGGGSLSARPPAAVLERGDSVGWTFTAPADTVISGFTIHRHATWGASADERSTTTYVASLIHGSPAYWVDTQAGEECLPIDPSTWLPPGCPGMGVANPPDDPRNAYTRDGLSQVSQVSLGITCLSVAGTCTTTDYIGAGELTIFDSRITLSEDSPPRFESPVELGPGAASVSVSDAGSGVSSLLAFIDGRLAATAEAASVQSSCRVPYTEPVPCPARWDATLVLPPSAPGGHLLQIAAIDAAGNRALSPATSFTTPATPASGLERGAWLTAWFVGKDRKMAKTVAYGATARVRGAAMTAAGAPIARAALAVRQLGAGARPQGSVTTDAKGRFAYSVRPAANEVLRFAYPARGGAGSTAVAQLTLRVRAGVKLKTTPSRVRNGTRMRFAGQVLGRGIKQRPLVTIAVLADGPRSLIPVATVRTRANGRFGYAYRFSRIVGPSTYRFVAIVPKQSGFPYVEGRSTVVVVRGRP